MASYSEFEAETSFSRLVEEAVAGEDVVVSRAGARLVRIVAVPKKRAGLPTVFGQKVFGDLDLTPGLKMTFRWAGFAHLQQT